VAAVEQIDNILPYWRFCLCLKMFHLRPLYLIVIKVASENGVKYPDIYLAIVTNVVTH
jgi:hypothetical protein